jgi:hypothetical protein
VHSAGARDYYFAYGSNMNPSRVSARGLDVVSARRATLAGFRLVFDKCASDHPRSAHANLAWDPSGLVEGVLYALASEAEIEKMDAFERAPINYSRERVVVTADGDRVVAWAYFANPAVRRAGLRPSRGYLAHLLAGRRYLSLDYVAALEALAYVDE